MLAITSYDISDDRKREKIRNFLRNNGFVRLHKSVYIGDIDFQNFIFLKKYFKKLSSETDVEIEIATLCKKCERRFKRIKNKPLIEFDNTTVFV